MPKHIEDILNLLKQSEICIELAEKTDNNNKNIKIISEAGKHTVNLLETYKTKIDFHHMVEEHFLEKTMEKCFQNCEMELCIGYLISHGEFGELLSNLDGIY